MLAHDALFTTPTCRAFALEQNHRLFHQANALSQCALDLLDAPTLDAEAFAHYQALRRKADRFCPFTTRLPEVGRSIEAINLTSVVLPAPEWPVISTICALLSSDASLNSDKPLPSGRCRSRVIA